MGESILTGALIGAVIGGGFVIVMWIVASKAKPSFDVTIRRDGTFSVPQAPADALQAIQKGIASQGLKVEIVDKPGGRMVLSEGTTFMSFGHFVVVTVADDGSGGAAITVGLATKVPQYGPVVTRNHTKMVDKVKAAVGATA